MHDDSSYMGINTNLENVVTAEEPKDPNADVLAEQMAETQALTLAKGAFVKILESEIETVGSIQDLPNLSKLTPENLQARAIETIVRERYASLVTNLLHRIKDLGSKDA